MGAGNYSTTLKFSTERAQQDFIEQLANTEFTMDFYQINLAVFASINAYLLYRQYQKASRGPDFTLVDPTSIEHQEREEEAHAAYRFQINFLAPYALAVAADWLQVYTYYTRSLAQPREPRLTNSISPGPPHICHLQVREEHGGKDSCGSVCRWVRCRRHQRLFCWGTGRQIWQKAGTPTILRSLRSDLPYHAQ